MVSSAPVLRKVRPGGGWFVVVVGFTFVKWLVYICKVISFTFVKWGVTSVTTVK